MVAKAVDKREPITYNFIDVETKEVYQDLKIANTINDLDGGCFSTLESKLNIHTGVSKKMKSKMIIYFLENRVK